MARAERLGGAKELPTRLAGPRTGDRKKDMPGVQDASREARVIRGQQMNNDHLMGLVRELQRVVNQHADMLNEIARTLESFTS